ncbi:acyl carrier protein [Actinoalloteichus sp. AHMU CJ021]|uniref:acyl carrier protein n=1 Tax=Actinoalloteichus sp. AHMU CJ021 TaxID=2072503 RepID=UPI000CA070F2|nr:acyl carrier protein [Actinoalloteichus sp. AHMU CJ021]
MAQDVRAEVRQFITGRFPQITLDDDQDIFALGFVNSLFAMELVMFVEQRLGVRVPNDELRRENFSSVTAMAALVDRVGTGTEATAG